MLKSLDLSYNDINDIDLSYNDIVRAAGAGAERLASALYPGGEGSGIP